MDNDLLKKKEECDKEILKLSIEFDNKRKEAKELDKKIRRMKRYRRSLDEKPLPPHKLRKRGYDSTYRAKHGDKIRRKQRWRYRINNRQKKVKPLIEKKIRWSKENDIETFLSYNEIVRYKTNDMLNEFIRKRLIALK